MCILSDGVGTNIIPVLEMMKPSHQEVKES